MGRLAATLSVALPVALVAMACAGPGGSTSGAGGGRPRPFQPPATVELPDPARELLSRARPEAAFRATYEVLYRLSSTTTTVHVASGPEGTRVEAGDVVVVTGPDPSTCRRSTAKCVPEVQEQALAGAGVFTGFATTGPVEAVTTLASRADARVARTTRTEAGVPLDCLVVSVGGAAGGRAGEWCLTPEGVFGYVDTPSVLARLTSYAPGPPAG